MNDYRLFNRQIMVNGMDNYQQYMACAKFWGVGDPPAGRIIRKILQAFDDRMPSHAGNDMPCGMQGYLQDWVNFTKLDYDVWLVAPGHGHRNWSLELS